MAEQPLASSVIHISLKVLRDSMYLLLCNMQCLEHWGALILIGVEAIGAIIIISGIWVLPHHEALAHSGGTRRAQRNTSATLANQAFIY